MKKTYISPNMLVVRIGITRPIAGSPLEVDENGGSGTLIDDDATGEAMGRDNNVSDYNIWDNKW